MKWVRTKRYAPLCKHIYQYTARVFHANKKISVWIQGLGKTEPNKYLFIPPPDWLLFLLLSLTYICPNPQSQVWILGLLTVFTWYHKAVLVAFPKWWISSPLGNNLLDFVCKNVLLFGKTNILPTCRNGSRH